MISSHLRFVRYSSSTLKRSCITCQAVNDWPVRRSYNNQISCVNDAAKNLILHLSKSKIHNNIFTTIRSASSASTQDVEKPKPKAKKVTTLSIASKKRRSEKITMVTAYDHPSAVHVDRAGVDILLVGDSCAMVELGFETTQVCFAVY